MKNTIKKAVSVLLAVTVILTSLAVAGFSASAHSNDEYFTYEVQFGEAQITGYNRKVTGTLTIPEEIDGYKVTSIGDSAFWSRKGIKKIVIPETVEEICSYAFSDCIGVQEIVFPENGNISIADHAFLGCTALEEVTIPSSVKIIDGFAFQECTALRKVYYNAVSATGNRWVFDGCNQISEFTFGDAVKDMPRLTDTKIKSIVIPEGVTEITYMAFNGCTELEEITVLGEINSVIEGVSEWGAFYGTPFYNNPANRENGVLYLGNVLIDADESVNYGNYKVKEGTVAINDYAFNQCDKLTGITLPDTIEEIGSYAFDFTAFDSEENYENGVLYAGDYAIKGLGGYDSLVIKDSVKLIADSAFTYCTMNSLTIPASVKKIGNSAFTDCKNLEKVYFEGNADEWCSIDFENKSAAPLYQGNKLYLEGQPAVDVTLSEGIEIIPDLAFSSVLLKNITIPSSVKSIGYSAFCNATALETVTAEEGVQKIGTNAFANCNSLTEFDMPDSVTEIGEFAFGLSGVTKVCLSDSLEVISENAFEGSAINEIEFGSNNKVIGRSAFWNCCNLEKIVIPESIKIIYNYAFKDCEKLKEVTFSDSLDYIGSNAFLDCKNLNKINCNGIIENAGVGVFVRCPISDKNFFYLGKNLITAFVETTDYTVKQGTKAILSEAFYSETLETIYIPASVKIIDSTAFDYVSSLKNIYVDSANTEFSSDENGVLYNKDKTKLIYYPAGKTDISFTVPDSVKEISPYAFKYSSLKNITLGKNTECIGVAAFTYNEFLRNVYIPESTSLIYDGAFNKCNEFKCVYYEGDKSEWQDIEILDDYTNANAPLFNATFIYEADSIPDTPNSIGFLDNLWITVKNRIIEMILTILHFFMII